MLNEYDEDNSGKGIENEEHHNYENLQWNGSPILSNILKEKNDIIKEK